MNQKADLASPTDFQPKICIAAQRGNLQKYCILSFKGPSKDMCFCVRLCKFFYPEMKSGTGTGDPANGISLSKANLSLSSCIKYSCPILAALPGSGFAYLGKRKSTWMCKAHPVLSPPCIVCFWVPVSRLNNMISLWDGPTKAERANPYFFAAASLPLPAAEKS